MKTIIDSEIQAHPVTLPTSVLTVLDWIDRELSDTFALSWGRGGNVLLELRHIFKQPGINAVIGRFYRLLPRLERGHFLLGYRIRQWLSLNFEIVVSDPLERVDAQTYPLTQSDQSLLDPRRDFFEHARITLPFRDIRVEVRKIS